MHIEPVVKGQFLILGDISFSEDPHAGLAKDIPLLGLTIRVTRMVDKAGEVTLTGGIDDLIIASGHYVSVVGIPILSQSILASFAVQ